MKAKSSGSVHQLMQAMQLPNSTDVKTKSSGSITPVLAATEQHLREDWVKQLGHVVDDGLTKSPIKGIQGCDTARGLPITQTQVNHELRRQAGQL